MTDSRNPHDRPFDEFDDDELEREWAAGRDELADVFRHDDAPESDVRSDSHSVVESSVVESSGNVATAPDAGYVPAVEVSADDGYIAAESASDDAYGSVAASQPDGASDTDRAAHPDPAAGTAWTTDTAADAEAGEVEQTGSAATVAPAAHSPGFGAQWAGQTSDHAADDASQWTGNARDEQFADQWTGTQAPESASDFASQWVGSAPQGEAAQPASEYEHPDSETWTAAADEPAADELTASDTTDEATATATSDDLTASEALTAAVQSTPFETSEPEESSVPDRDSFFDDAMYAPTSSVAGTPASTITGGAGSGDAGAEAEHEGVAAYASESHGDSETQAETSADVPPAEPDDSFGFAADATVSEATVDTTSVESDGFESADPITTDASSAGDVAAEPEQGAPITDVDSAHAELGDIDIESADVLSHVQWGQETEAAALTGAAAAGLAAAGLGVGAAAASHASQSDAEHAGQDAGWILDESNALPGNADEAAAAVVSSEPQGSEPSEESYGDTQDDAPAEPLATAWEAGESRNLDDVTDGVVIDEVSAADAPLVDADHADDRERSEEGAAAAAAADPSGLTGAALAGLTAAGISGAAWSVEETAVPADQPTHDTIETADGRIVEVDTTRPAELQAIDADPDMPRIIDGTISHAPDVDTEFKSQFGPANWATESPADRTIEPDGSVGIDPLAPPVRSDADTQADAPTDADTVVAEVASIVPGAEVEAVSGDHDEIGEGHSATEDADRLAALHAERNDERASQEAAFPDPTLGLTGAAAAGMAAAGIGQWGAPVEPADVTDVRRDTVETSDGRVVEIDTERPAELQAIDADPDMPTIIDATAVPTTGIDAPSEPVDSFGNDSGYENVAPGIDGPDHGVSEEEYADETWDDESPAIPDHGLTGPAAAGFAASGLASEGPYGSVERPEAVTNDAASAEQITSEAPANQNETVEFENVASDNSYGGPEREIVDIAANENQDVEPESDENIAGVTIDEVSSELQDRSSDSRLDTVETDDGRIVEVDTTRPAELRDIDADPEMPTIIDATAVPTGSLPLPGDPQPPTVDPGNDPVPPAFEPERGPIVDPIPPTTEPEPIVDPTPDPIPAPAVGSADHAGLTGAAAAGLAAAGFGAVFSSPAVSHEPEIEQGDARAEWAESESAETVSAETVSAESVPAATESGETESADSESAEWTGGDADHAPGLTGPVAGLAAAGPGASTGFDTPAVFTTPVVSEEPAVESEEGIVADEVANARIIDDSVDQSVPEVSAADPVEVSATFEEAEGGAAHAMEEVSASYEPGAAAMPTIVSDTESESVLVESAVEPVADEVGSPRDAVSRPEASSDHGLGLTGAAAAGLAAAGYGQRPSVVSEPSDVAEASFTSVEGDVTGGSVAGESITDASVDAEAEVDIAHAEAPVDDPGIEPSPRGGWFEKARARIADLFEDEDGEQLPPEHR